MYNKKVGLPDRIGRANQIFDQRLGNANPAYQLMVVTTKSP